MKPLVLLANEIDSLNYTVDSNVADTAVIYPSINLLWRGIRRLYHISGLPKFCIFWSLKKEEIQKYDSIIIFECMYPMDIIEYIRKINKKCRIIYWFWGSIVDKKNTPLYPSKKYTKQLLKNRQKYNYELWSFDRSDCCKYNLQYNNQMGVKFNYCEKNKATTDVFFMGQDKNRIEQINELAGLFDKLGISFDFRIIPTPRKKYSKDEKYLWKKSLLPYQKMIKEELNSKCLLELVQQGQGDITWRALEAFFTKKN